MSPGTVALLAIALAAIAIAIHLWIDRRRLRADLDRAESDAAAQERDLAEARERAAALDARLTAEARAADDKDLALAKRLKEAHETFAATIEASAGKALNDTSTNFRAWALMTFGKEQSAAREALDAKVKPITDLLGKTEQKLGDIEKERLAAYERLASQMRHVGELNKSLRTETANLARALRKPQVRGRYGEVQLRRVAELAGMRDYCDFDEQASARDEQGALKRPDMIVRLPNGRRIVIDAKTNIEAYLDALESSDPAEADAHLDRFARHVADQADALSKKGYWADFDGAHDFVVMFIPGDQFIDAALQRRPDLIEFGDQRRVILASPSTLIGLLRAVYVGWREKGLSDRANELFELGRELHKRAATAFEHLDHLGQSLTKASEHYNRAVGSVERQLLPTLRKFEDAGARSDKPLPDPQPVETVIRPARSLAAPSDAGD
jgi:DNA recombination protein RmuC